jgi:hypothetical protein
MLTILLAVREPAAQVLMITLQRVCSQSAVVPHYGCVLTFGLFLSLQWLDESLDDPRRAVITKILVELGSAQDSAPINLMISDLYRGSAIGHGGFGQVYKGVWKRKLSPGQVTEEPVAIKRLWTKQPGSKPESPMRVSPFDFITVLTHAF